MNNSLRPAPGPRDWTPAGGSGFGGLPSLSSDSFDSQPKPYRAPRRGATWAGYLALVLGFASVASILQPDVQPTLLSWLVALSGPAGLAVGAFTLGGWGRRGLLERFGGIVGVALGSIAILSLLAAFSTLSSNIPGTPLVPAPTSPAVVDSANPDDLTNDDINDRQRLTQTAGTAVYLIGLEVETTGSLPQAVYIENDRLYVGQNGAKVVVLENSAVTYGISADGINYVLSLADPYGNLIYYNSQVGSLQYG